jgi:hypothetical protein
MQYSVETYYGTEHQQITEQKRMEIWRQRLEGRKRMLHKLSWVKMKDWEYERSGIQKMIKELLDVDNISKYDSYGHVRSWEISIPHLCYMADIMIACLKIADHPDNLGGRARSRGWIKRMFGEPRFSFELNIQVDDPYESSLKVYRLLNYLKETYSRELQQEFELHVKLVKPPERRILELETR